MGAYLTIRGWVDCFTAEQFTLTRQIIDADTDMYSSGWAFPARPWNSGGGYAFYGSTIRDSSTDWFLALLRRIAAIPADPDGDGVTGLFLVHHEVHGAEQWHVRDGTVVASPADPAHAYLDD